MNEERLINYRLGGEEWQPRFLASFDGKKCVSCGLCMNTCPGSVFIRTVKGMIEPRNRRRCIGCAVCERICPEKAIKCATFTELADQGLLPADQ